LEERCFPRRGAGIGKADFGCGEGLAVLDKNGISSTEMTSGDLPLQEKEKEGRGYFGN